MKASESKYSKIDWLPTGFRELDRILGGGVPSRKILEVSGQFSVGKSTLALMMVARAQKAGMDCLWADSEFSYGEDYASTLGVNSDELDLLQERFAEDTLDEIEAWADSHKNGLIVLDSVGGLLPRQEAEKDASGKTIGGQAKLIATFCRKIVPILAINNHALVILNHQFVDIMTSRLKTSGGAKLEYSKSIWLKLRSVGVIKQGDEAIGVKIEAEIGKNKLVGTSKQSTSLDLMFGEGFSTEVSLIAEAMEAGVIVKKGNTYLFNGEKIGVGMGKVREALKEPSFAEKITEALKS